MVLKTAASGNNNPDAGSGVTLCDLGKLWTIIVLSFHMCKTSVPVWLP
jgi:hypothetical protein